MLMCLVWAKWMVTFRSHQLLVRVAGDIVKLPLNGCLLQDLGSQSKSIFTLIGCRPTV